MKLTDAAPPTTGGNYFKPSKDMKAGETVRLRIVSDFAECVIGWTAEKGGKPVRMPYRGKDVSLAQHFAPGAVISTEDSPIRYNLTCEAYNYGMKRIQVWDIAQATIYQPLKKFASNPKYGDPTRWDVLIEKSEASGKVSYTVMADPPEDMSEEVKDAWAEVNARGYDRAELFRGGNPFEPVVVGGVVQKSRPETDEIPF